MRGPNHIKKLFFVAVANGVMGMCTRESAAENRPEVWEMTSRLNEVFDAVMPRKAVADVKQGIKLYGYLAADIAMESIAAEKIQASAMLKNGKTVQQNVTAALMQDDMDSAGALATALAGSRFGMMSLIRGRMDHYGINGDVQINGIINAQESEVAMVRKQTQHRFVSFLFEEPQFMQDFDAAQKAEETLCKNLATPAPLAQLRDAAPSGNYVMRCGFAKP
jgi:hypothetical protein